MALYEQFTVPSNRFVLSDGSILFPHPQQGHGNAVVNDDDKSRAVSQAESVEKSSPRALTTITVVASETRSDSGTASEEKPKDRNDLCIPALFSSSAESGKAACTTSRDPHISCSGSASVVVNSVVGARISSIAERLQEASITCKAGLECSNYAIQSCDSPRAKRAKVVREALLAHVSSEGQPEQKVQEGLDEMSGSQNEDRSGILSGHSGQEPVFTDVRSLPEPEPEPEPEPGAVFQEKPSHVPGAAEVGMSSQYTSTGECISQAGDETDSVKMTSGNIRSLPSKVSVSPLHALEISLLCKEDPEASFLHRDDPVGNEAQEDRSPVLEENVGAKSGGSPTCRLDHTTGNNCVSTGDPDNFRDDNGEVSKTLQCGNVNGSGSDKSMLDSVCAPSISPKVVIRAVGQQKFWKARSGILRQWRIFSDQVFELHKLIKVQRLLAEIPNVMFEEETNCGAANVMPECDAGASPGDTGKKTNYIDKKKHSPLKDVDKGLLPGAGAQPGLASSYPSWSQVPKNDSDRVIHSGSFSSRPALIPGGMATWGYPSLGTGQWMEPSAAQAGAFLYPPFAETHSTGSVLGGAYGSAVLGPGSQIWPPPMASFSFPGCDTRPEYPLDMHSRYGPAVPPCHQWPPAMYQNFPLGPMAPDFRGSWYAMQCNLMNHNHRSLAFGNDKDMPLDSVESMTNWASASMNTVKKSCFSGTQLHQGTNNYTSESDAEGIDRSLCQAPQYSLSMADGSNANVGSSAPSITFSEKAKCGHQDEQEWAQSRGDNDHGGGKIARQAEEWRGQVIKVVPRAAVSASESAAGILLSIQKERQQ